MKVVEDRWPIGRETSCDDGLGVDFLLELEAPIVTNDVEKMMAV